LSTLFSQADEPVRGAYFSSEILRASPSSSEAMLIRGKVLYQIGAIQQALKHFKEALNLDPDLKEAM
jgi:tetratricopeptide (TPR) repeat protein